MVKVVCPQVLILLGFPHFMPGFYFIPPHPLFSLQKMWNHCTNFCSYSNLYLFCKIESSALGPWHAVIAYDACVRLCLHAWAKGCMEAPMFLENECALLRNAFKLVLFILLNLF